MSDLHDDAQRRLEQQALRNVRSLLDKLEAEDSGDITPRGLLTLALVIVGCLALLGMCTFLAGRASPPAHPEVTAGSPTTSVPVSRDDRRIQILRKDARSGEFQFDHQVFKVDAGPNTDIEHAMVKRMIVLIREQYPKDFRWDSRRLGRIVTLSARPEDNDGLEQFLIKEFFATPTPPPPARRQYVSTGRGTRYETYASAFAQRVERTANAHYPEELRGFSGSAQLTTGIRSDGSILSIEINRSSGDPKIDAAATNFVRQAFPFDALSAHGLNDIDVLYIVRTFEFNPRKSSVLIPP